MTVMALPKRLRLYFRTSNHIERLNSELKRRSNVIGIFPNSESLLRLMGSVLIELSEAAQARKAIYTPETYKSMLDSETPVRLRVIASEQNQKLIA
jgi:transposase-like protein